MTRQPVHVLLVAASVAALSVAALSAVVLDARQTPSANTIWVTANVIHRDGHLISDLTAADFAVTDGGQPRDITAFRNDPIPIALALMVDVSSSMESNYSLIRRAVAGLTSHFEPGDRAVLGSFDALPWIGNRFSARPDVLQKSLGAVLGGTLDLCDGDWIDKTSISTRFSREGQGKFAGMGAISEFSRRLKIHGGSAIWDGAACGVNAVASDGETPRRIVVLLTDGLDTMSSSTIASVVARANQAGVMIYAVSLMGGYGMAGGALKGLADATGGGYFFLTGEDKVGDAFTRIGDELRHQYVFGFSPSGSAGGSHDIAVSTTASDATVRFRRVYMESPAVQPPVARASGRAAIVSALPASLSPGDRVIPVTPIVPPPPPKRGRTPFWDTLDQFTHDDWPSGTAPRFTIDQLRTLGGMLKRDGEDWIASGSAADVPDRRLAGAAYVLDLLYTQNDPFVWLPRQPVPDLLEWAADTLQRNPPTVEERLWYFGALALLERAGVPDVLERFAERARSRFPDEGRFALARGVAADLRTWPEERDVRAFSAPAATTSALVARYEEAIALPAVEAEARLRLAFFDVRRGRAADALARMDTIAVATIDDATLRFWIHLIRGRAFEQTGALDRAVDEFQQALDDVPGATSATSALIAALTKARQFAAATRLAATALSLAPAAVDPWTMYVLPDMRFWPEIERSLRRAVAR